ncbi:hypothetical protein PC41400_21530 [Paenibacillus chitinolyticus]|nr:hypothetical protein PC41400_21530 [Paenibacillus chitinolyticus]
MEDMKKMHDTMVDVRLELRTISAKVDILTDASRKIEEIEDVAKGAMDSTKTAHKRLDKIDKFITWFTTTVIGAIILAIMGFLIRGGFNLPK